MKERLEDMEFANRRIDSGLFSQSNMGVVTKMGFGLMPNPGDHESYVRISLVSGFAQWLTEYLAVHIPKRRGSKPIGIMNSILTAHYLP